MVEIRRRRWRRVFAVVTVLAAIGTIVGVSMRKVADKDVFFAIMPVCGLLAATLVMPWLSRGSSGARMAALAYIGGPCGAFVALPFAVLPARVVPYAGSGFSLVIAVLVFLHERRVARVSLDEGWVEDRGRRVAFDDLIGVTWDAIEIEVRAMVIRIEGVARLALTARDGHRITFDSGNDAVDSPLLAELRDATCAAVAARIDEATEDGKTLETPCMTFAPDRIELRRPRWWSIQELIVVFAVFGAIPIAIGVGMWMQERRPNGFLALVPLGAILLLLGVDALMRRKPVVLDASMTAGLANGRLFWVRGKRQRSCSLRFLPNGLIVPRALEAIRRRAAG